MAKSRSKLLASASYDALRRASPAENVRMGHSPKARRYVLTSVQKITKATPSMSARQAETRRTQERYGIALPEIATEARKQGALDYVTTDQRERVAKAAQTREVNRRIDEKAKARAAKYGFSSDKKQTRKVLDYLEEQFTKHDRYLAGRRGELPEAEYRETVELMFRYYGPDDERVRNMQMSPAMMAV